MTHVIVATWKVKPGQAENVQAILTELAQESRKEAGVLMFIANRSREAPDHFILYEQYRDEAAFLAHQQTEHFKRLVLGQALPKLAFRERVPCEVLA